jgi:hypothetical protein
MILMEKPLGTQKCRRMDNIKMDLRDLGWGGIDWVDLAQDMNR